MSWQDDPIVSSGAPKQSWENDPIVDAPSKTESFLRGAGNNFPLAPQAIALGEKVTGLGDEGGYSKNLEDWNKKAAEAKQANPKTYGAGAVTGALAPLAIPGIGEALEAAPITTNAALGAAGSISNRDLTKDPMGTLKDATLGAGVGGATAGVLGKVLPSAEGLQNFAGKKAIQSVEMPTGIVGAMEPEERQVLGKFIQDNGLVGRDKSQVLEHARELSEQFGKKIGEVAGEAEKNGLTLDPDVHISKVNELLSKSQQFKGSANREAKSLARDYTAGASDIVNLSDNPSWKEIQSLKEQYGKLAFNSKGEIKSEGAKDTYFALKEMLKSIADKAQTNPNLGNEYKQALANYSRMQPIESGLEKAVDSELRGTGSGMGVRGLAGLVKKLPGPVRAIAGPAAVAMGHPIVGLAAALPELTDSALQSKAASAASKIAPYIGKGLPQEVIDYVNSKRKR